MHAPKRSRGPEWPLKNTDKAAEVSLDKESEENAAGNGDERSNATSIRPSKFLEGSMNDKVSQKPPSMYIGDDEAMERYAKSQENDGDQMEVTYEAGIEPNKHSGMFRFGKAIASAFNAVNIWQGVNSIRKEKEKEKGSQANAEKNILVERQAKAVEAYSELKRSGYKSTQVGPIQRHTQDIPAIKPEDTENTQRDSFRDSGIDVDGFRSSSDRKNSDQMAVTNDTLKVPQTKGSNNRSVSPLSEASSGRKSSMHFRRPSLQDLKKVKSQLRLSSAKNQAGPPTPVPSLNTEDAASSTLPASGLRKEPSKRDIAKQYKLSKKVSDLENKLETARRELEQSMSNAPPVPELPARTGRKSFKPGALTSLPSERNMAPENLEARGAPTQIAEMPGKDAKALEENGPQAPQHTSRREKENLRPTSKYSISTRRSSVCFSVDDKMNQLSTKSDNVVVVEPAKSSTSNRRAGRPRKAPENDNTASSNSADVEKPKLNIPSKTPQNSPLRETEIPPLPAKPKAFDTIEVDQAKIIAMRSGRNSKAAFASIPEDIHNLWKACPGAAEDQLSEYVRSQPGFNKIIDPTSVLHPLGSTSSFLGPPVSTPPMRTRSKRSSKRGISPPPPSIASAKKPRTENDAKRTAMEGVESPVLGESKDQPLNSKAPKKKYGQSIEASKCYKDKPLPDIQKEDYDWPEDVF